MSVNRPLKTVLVMQGEFRISAEPDVVLASILGSCVATCLYDPVAGIGGMNHFLLPGDDLEALRVNRYGRELTRSLIRDLELAGAVRGRLTAKLFGGGRIIAGMVNIGALNANFAESFLASEGIPILMKSTGGERARRVRFWPASGRAQQLLLEPVGLDGDGTVDRR